MLALPSALTKRFRLMQSHLFGEVVPVWWSVPLWRSVSVWRDCIFRNADLPSGCSSLSRERVSAARRGRRDKRESRASVERDAAHLATDDRE